MNQPNHASKAGMENGSCVGVDDGGGLDVPVGINVGVVTFVEIVRVLVRVGVEVSSVLQPPIQD